MKNSLSMKIKKLNPDVTLPRYAYPGDAGLDLSAAEDAVLQPFERRLISTGIAVAIPEGYAGFVLPRSGLAVKSGISIVNAPGLVDSGYRGELKVALLNTDAHEPFKLSVGDRIAQLVILETPVVSLEEVDELPDSVRGTGGFGSSGVSA
ncbi:dUTP diphosphatase [Eggerthellaceae bacterium zg-1084]|uniref:Deoxyuridine 5'-triphosphate nucleotidohydrolase n=1 Tax=Berryella wangjianweii TaxID=2734634 RepID=A0A6M8J676_9ACTN|nr:dUTP diphosphatase [Berryella wangjianweii]NPD30282.1 dUTP diphosphatase [Berryella wangjianweii]NPD32585.1 dUTP diphosphatase [Eggerthellaceae bacterium zg-997]QKF06969.1 dUTP diphosphatase [Berryella wangjianweii]